MRLYFTLFFVVLSIPLGALILELVATLARATWLAGIRPILDALTKTLPLFLIFYVPIALRLNDIYPWVHPAQVDDATARAAIDHAHVWLSPAFFVVRAYIYMSVWCALVFAVRRSSSRAIALSAGGLPLVLVTISFAGFDWLMSLQPGWTSDMFGIYVAAGCFAGAMGTLCVSFYVARHRPFSAGSAISADHLYAVGRVLLVSVMVWAYLGFCQFLLIWIGDLPEEIPFYADRSAGHWMWLSVALITIGFVIPFLLLLSKKLKRNVGALASVGALVVVAHVLDVVWMVMPSP